MVIRDRLFPYPVLCEDTDDYVEGSFHVGIELVNQDANSTDLKFNIELNNPGIKGLISRGQAKYVIHLECSNTAFRTAISSFSDSISYRLMNKNVNGDVAVLAMVVAEEKIPFYKNAALNEDYGDVDLIIERASIMAYENLQPIRIHKNYEELGERDPIFTIVKEERMDSNEEKAIWFNAEGDKIQIFVNEDVYTSYTNYCGNTSMRPFVLSVLVVPALTYVIELLRKNEDDIENYAKNHWFMKLEKYYKLNNKDFIDDIIYGDKYISEVVQEMLQFPLSNTMIEIPVLLGE